MYQLYTDYMSKEIKLSKIKFKSFLAWMEAKKTNPNYKTTDIIYYNEQYNFCEDRKTLKKMAEDIKEMWIKEIEINLVQVKNIKI